jgi:hypothetical protein
MDTNSAGEPMLSPYSARPTALVFGNRVAPYHPLGGVEAAFRAIFGAEFQLRFSEDTAELATGLGGVRLVIGYADTWQTAPADAPAAALVEFVEHGGGLLVLHNGVCWAKHPRLLPLIGAAFASHPEQTELSYRLQGAHPLAAGQPGFTLREEPYRYDFAPEFSAEIFFHYEHEGRSWPAGWANRHGDGRIVVLQPGHRVTAFQHPTYAALCLRAARWCARMG